MQKEGFANPKVIVFYRDEKAELGTYMIDLAPQSYFDDRNAIMQKVGEFLKTKKGKEILSFDTLIQYGEAKVDIDGQQKDVIMAVAQNEKGESVTRFKEIQRYLMLDHPEKQFFNLADLELEGVNYESSTLQELSNSFNK